MPLGAAVVALLGVVVGQLASAWAETRRQRRDFNQRAFEHWRDKRLEVYSDYLNAVGSWEAAAIRAAHFKDLDQLDGGKNNRDDSARDPLFELRREAFELLDSSIERLKHTHTLILLVGSGYWSGVTTEMYRQMLKFYTKLITVGPESPRTENKPLTDEVKELYEAHASMTFELRRAAREELQIYIDNTLE